MIETKPVAEKPTEVTIEEDKDLLDSDLRRRVVMSRDGSDPTRNNSPVPTDDDVSEKSIEKPNEKISFGKLAAQNLLQENKPVEKPVEQTVVKSFSLDTQEKPEIIEPEKTETEEPVSKVLDPVLKPIVVKSKKIRLPTRTEKSAAAKEELKEKLLKEMRSKHNAKPEVKEENLQKVFRKKII